MAATGSINIFNILAIARRHVTTSAAEKVIADISKSKKKEDVMAKIKIGK